MDVEENIDKEPKSPRLSLRKKLKLIKIKKNKKVLEQTEPSPVLQDDGDGDGDQPRINFMFWNTNYYIKYFSEQSFKEQSDIINIESQEEEMEKIKMNTKIQRIKKKYGKRSLTYN